MFKYLKYILPLIVFIAIVIFLANALTQTPTKQLKSTLINEKAPAFSLPILNPDKAQLEKNFKSTQLKGDIWLLNVFASWCVTCAQEHKVITKLAQEHQLNIIGLNYKDAIQDASNWLKRFGNPYKIIVRDAKGLTGIDYGVTGTPETFIIDHNGIIQHKFVGAITENQIDNVILPLIAQIKQNAAKHANNL